MEQILTASEKHSDNIKVFIFPAIAILLLQFVNIGRPQDVFRSLRIVHPGDISVGLCLIAAVTYWSKTPEIKIFRSSIIVKFRNICLLMIAIIPICMIPAKSFTYMVSEFSLKVFYLLCFYRFINSIRHIRSSVLVMLMSSLMLSISMLLKGNAVGRISIGTTYDPNDIALLFVSILPLAFCLLQFDRGLSKIFAALTAIVSLAALGLTQSRGGYLGLFIIIVFWLFQNKSFSPKNRGKTIIICTVVLLLTLSFMPSAVVNRFKSSTEKGSTGSGRLTVWPRVIKMMILHPQGVGAGNFTSAYGRHLSAGDFKSTEDTARETAWMTAHNSFLLVGGELGFIGLYMYINWLYYIYKRLSWLKKQVQLNELSDNLFQYCSMVQLGLIGFIVPAFFLSQSFSHILLTYAAYAATLDRLIVSTITSSFEPKI